MILFYLFIAIRLPLTTVVLSYKNQFHTPNWERCLIPTEDRAQDELEISVMPDITESTETDSP